MFLPRLNTMRIPITLHTAQKKANDIAFLDCGAMECFIGQWFIDAHKLGVRLMKNPWKLQNADGSPMLRLFPLPYPDSIPDRLPYPDRPLRLLSMTNRTPKTSIPKILRQYPYRSPRLCLSMRHVIPYPHQLQLHLPTCRSPYHGL